YCIGDDGENGYIARSEDGDTWDVVHSEEFVLPNTAWRLLGALKFQDRAATGEPVPLHLIASFIHDRVDIPASKFDVAQLTDLVEGVVFSDGYTGADAMRSAMAWYQFDAVEAD